MALIVDTDATFQPTMSPLKVEADWKVSCMFDTEATFHLLMSSLNAALL
jgi:hypothetical protein